MTSEQKRIAELEARVEELEWQVEALMGVSLAPPDGMSAKRLHLGQLLAARSPMVVTNEALIHAVVDKVLESEYPMGVLKAQMSRLRRFLRPHGIEIETVWGVGYRMTKENAAKWNALVAKHNTQEAAA